MKVRQLILTALPISGKPNFKGRSEDSWFSQMASGMYSQKPDSFEKEDPQEDDFGSMMSSRDSALKSFAVSESNKIYDYSHDNFDMLTDFTWTLRHLGISEEKAENEFFVILGAYDVDREYHNCEHLENMLKNLSAYRDLTRLKMQNYDLLKLAIYYHDFIMGVPDGESKSAEAAASVLEKSNNKNLKQQTNILKKLILATDHKRDLSNATDEEKLISDLDMAILASEPDEYDKYANDVRKEYKNRNYSDKEYNYGRAKVLKKLLNQKQIFYTPFFNLNYEAKARENIQNELESLNKD